MKKNGFTLVELLAMLVILGIVIAIAIPNISGMLQNQKLGMIKNDAVSMVEAAKMKASKERFMYKPKKNECVLFSLNYLNENDNIVKGPNGGEYDMFDSVVLYTRKGNKYVYYVRLVENYNGKRTGIHLLESSNISSLQSIDIEEVDDNIGIVKTDTLDEVNSKIDTFGAINLLCGNRPFIKQYYSGGNYCVYKNGVYYDIDGNVVTESVYHSKCS